MKNLFTRFTPKTRQAIYTAIAALVPALVALGVISDTAAGQILAIVSSALTVIGSLVAIANIATGAPIVETEVVEDLTAETPAE